MKGIGWYKVFQQCLIIIFWHSMEDGKIFSNFQIKFFLNSYIKIQTIHSEPSNYFKIS